tara:strand:- start:2727 stop:3011 length:285 start_codon:yes stop_codon:yes gene_type:complete
MTIFMIVLLGWLLPCLLCPIVAGDRGQDARITLLASFLLGWVGGIFAILLLPVDEEKRAELLEETFGRSDGKAKRRAKITEAEYERLMGGKRRS